MLPLRLLRAGGSCHAAAWVIASDDTSVLELDCSPAMVVASCREAVPPPEVESWSEAICG